MDPNAFVLTLIKIHSFKSIQGPVVLRPQRRAALLAVVGANGAGTSYLLWEDAIGPMCNGVPDRYT
jgi:hypothetical protein